ncbi:general substrate transporter [Naematelia encephala]|uniref:General substrate transporter n=1 Tax=Naematelia encephala TaxID=71784 RepID=A0A1Y2B7Y7_9TREE|nr:general substrate transporter [Naematelia encephala]
MVPAIVLCVGACFLPFSPRWLMLKGREEECLLNLAKLRSRTPEDPMVQYEFRALQAERLVEREAAKERYGIDEVNFRVSLLEYKRLLTTKPLLHRLMIGAAAQGLQQWTGINAIIYYAPTIFKQIGLTGGTIGLLATGVVGIVNFVFTIPAVLFVDNVGRRPMLAWGEANMAISHATVAAIIAVYGNRFDTHKTAGNAAVFMIYWYIATFAYTWGPLAWVVSAEVFPLDMRAKGMSISSATNWIMNFTVAEVTPVMITNIGYKTYIVFMCFCIVGFFYSIFILPELKGLSLEEVDAIFKDTSGTEDRERRERVARQIGLDKVAQQVHHKEMGGQSDAKTDGVPQGKRFGGEGV